MAGWVGGQMGVSDRQMDGWVVGGHIRQTDRWMDGWWVDRWCFRQMDGWHVWVGGQMGVSDIQIDGLVEDGQTDRWLGGWVADGQMDGLNGWLEWMDGTY